MHSLTEKIDTVFARRRLIWLQPRANTDTSITINGSLKFEQGTIERLKLVEARHKSVMDQTNQLRLLIINCH